MKKIILPLLVAAQILIGCSAKDSARIDAAFEIADVIVEIAEIAAPVDKAAPPAENEPATQ